MWRCSNELRERADMLHNSSRRDAKHYIGNQSVLCFKVEKQSSDAFRFAAKFIL